MTRAYRIETRRYLNFIMHYKGNGRLVIEVGEEKIVYDHERNGNVLWDSINQQSN